MKRSVPLAHRAILLTWVNLLLRFAGTVFGVYLSRQIGEQGLGLLQLTMSVGSLAMIAGIGGIRTAAMYLTAEELGRKCRRGLRWVLSGCLRYSLVCSVTVGGLLWVFAPAISKNWIGNTDIIGALRLFSCFLPITCLCAVLTGYFTGENRIGVLAAVEIGEQIFSMGVTVACLALWAGSDPGRACRSVILGSAMGSLLTLSLLGLLYRLERNEVGAPVPMGRRILRSALPLAIADTCKGGLSTLENLVVPKRLALAVSDPIGAFGRVTGMVFPVLMFPACILFGLSELLIPELARCRCGGGEKRISYLLHRSLKLALLHGVCFGGLLFLGAGALCLRLYNNPEAGNLLRLFAPLAPMLYCDAITDAMTKGLGQQHMAVRFNILTNILDVIGLYFLLPVWGLKGYFISFFLTHALNFYLSLRHLLRITGESLSAYIPVWTLTCAIASAWLCGKVPAPILSCASFVPVFFSSLYLTGVLKGEDIRWLRRLAKAK